MVLGSGFAGLEAAIHLAERLRRNADVEVVLVSENNYFLFTPLIPEVVSSYIEPRHCLQPIRDIRGRRRFRFIRARVTGIDLDGRTVALDQLAPVGYAYLVVALGSTPDFFGVPGAETYAFALRTLNDAIELREHLVDRFEHADQEVDPGTRRRILTFVVVGGGYTGVETVAEISDFIRGYVLMRYRGIHRGEPQLILLDGGPEILVGVDRDLAQRARQKLDRREIEVRPNSLVTRVWQDGLEINHGEVLEAGLVLWAAGVRGNPLVETLRVPRGRHGRIAVDATLQVPGYPEVFAVGDNAVIESLPQASAAIAPVALAQGRHAADNIIRSLGGKALQPFSFRPAGYLVSLGMNDAVIRVGGLKLGGYGAWLLWNAVHLLRLVGFKKQIQVALDWFLATLFPRDSSIIRPLARCPWCHPDLAATASHRSGEAVS